MNVKDRYIYPAIFDFDNDGITVTFPDLPGCITCGDCQEEAFRNAKEVLELYMYGLEQKNHNTRPKSPPLPRFLPLYPNQNTNKTDENMDQITPLLYTSFK